MKNLTMLVATAAMVLFLTGCGKGEDKATTETTTKTESSTTAAPADESVAPAAAPSEEATPESKDVQE